MQPGYVYALKNPSVCTLNGAQAIKIGATTRAPDQRQRELFYQTGLPYEYELIGAVYVHNVFAAEAYLHKALGMYRVENSEFFELPCEDMSRAALCWVALSVDQSDWKVVAANDDSHFIEHDP